MNAESSIEGSDLMSANSDFRSAKYATAMRKYVAAIVRLPEMAEALFDNIALSKDAYLSDRRSSPRLRVGVCGWELAHNAAGRAYILAKLYESFADVELIGFLFPKFGIDVWEPIRSQTKIACHSLIVDDYDRFMSQAIELVASHPYDVVHLSKPRAPNIIIGCLYKIIWAAKVVMDVDDEELSFIGVKEPINIDEYIAASRQLPGLSELSGTDWTRISVGLTRQFDGVTVSNSELQKRYGGTVIAHARDERLFQPSPEQTHASRVRFGVPTDKHVVLFFGTPRSHKGLEQTATAIASLRRSDVIFVIVGEFSDEALKKKLLDIDGVQYKFIGNQPFDSIPQVVAMGDFCVLLQRPAALVSRFQSPAKISDALGMGLTVLATKVAPLKSCFDAGACIDVNVATVASTLKIFLDDAELRLAQQTKARRFFTDRLSFNVVSQKLERYVRQLASKPLAEDPAKVFRAPDVPIWLLRLATKERPDATADPVGRQTDAASFVVSEETAKLAASTYREVLQRIVARGWKQEFEDALASSEERLIGVITAGSLARDPLVSVIMPTYNRAETIATSIATILEQNYENWELLVCDDGGMDDTSGVVASFGDPRILYCKLPKNGAAAARNSGLEMSRGEIIAYLDSDNFWHPQYLHAIVSSLSRNCGHSAIYCDYVDFYVDAQDRVRVNSIARPPFSHERLLKKPFIDLNSFAHRRELYECFGGFNTALTRRQDYDLIVKYTWLRDPLHLQCILTLYQRSEKLSQITKTKRHDNSCIGLIKATVDGYLRNGIPVRSERKLKRISIVSWDLSRNHFAKPFAIAEALSRSFEVQLLSFRFFEDEIFSPLKGVVPNFETVFLQGKPFPEFASILNEAVGRINGEVIYVVKPRLPSLGVALLANALTGVPIILEINDLETVVTNPGAEEAHRGEDLDTIGLSDVRLLNPHSELWSQLLEPLISFVPTLVTHNRGIDRHYGSRCLYMRNIKDEQVFSPELYDRNKTRVSLGYGPTDRVILFGGLLRKHKGIYEIIELLDRIADPRYKLLFVSSRITPDQKELRGKYGKAIRILPPQDAENMAKINHAADVVILWLNPDVPASHYQFPYKATDAFAMGTPVIANDISDLGDLARQGYLTEVKFGDWLGMKDALTAVVENTQDSLAMRAAARRLYERQFSYAAARGCFELALQRAVGGCPMRLILPVAVRFERRYKEFCSALTCEHVHEDLHPPT